MSDDAASPRRATDLPPGAFVAIAVMRHSEGWHAGILYRAVDEPLANLLHLAWDRDPLTANMP